MKGKTGVKDVNSLPPFTPVGVADKTPVVVTGVDVQSLVVGRVSHV